MRLIPLILIIVAQLACSAQALTWPEALGQAAKNNYEIKSAAKQTEAAQWSYYKSYSSFLPQLSATAATGQTTSGTLAATANSVSYGLSVSQSLFTGLANYYSNLSAKADYDYYISAQQKAEADLYYQLRQAFVDLSIADENILVYKQILERRQNNSDFIELRYETGREDKGSLLRTKADAADAAYNLAAAERARSLARLKLSQLVSAEVDKAEGAVSANIPGATDYEQLLLNAPAYKMSLKQLEKYELSYKQTVSEFLPSVSLSGSYRKSGTDWGSVSDSNSVSLNLSYSFFPGGANVADRVIAGVQYDKAWQDFQNGKDGLRYSIESAYRDLKDAVEAEAIARQSLAASALRAEIARTKYLNGLMTYDSWDIIENEYINAQRTLLTRKKAALYAEAGWYNSYGGYIK